MSVIGNTFLGMADIYKGKTKTGEVADIINMMAQTNSMVLDAVTRPCNEGKSHKYTNINSLPAVSWGMLNRGIPRSKAGRSQAVDTTGFVEGMSTVDARMAQLEPNLQQFRLQEAQTFMESLSQEMERAIIYENQDSNPEKITGLAPRYNSLSAENGSQIIDAGGTGSDNTSIWFITWGTDGCHLIYPQGSMAGIEREDHGRQRVLDEDGNPYYAFEETFRWHCGVAVRDWRKIVRIANIDVSAMQADPSNIDGSNNGLYYYMTKALHQLHGARNIDQGTAKNGMDGNFGKGRTAIYCNKDVFEALDLLGTNAGANDNYVRLSPREVEGRLVETYRNMPIRQSDQIVNTESRIT